MNRRRNGEAAGTRWGARPITAVLIKVGVFALPVGTSLAFVHFASKVVDPPTGSFWQFIAWWIGLSTTATAVLAAVGRLTRRALPIAALFKLSLVFPDRSPSRFKTALHTRTVSTLEQRVAEARASAGAGGQTVVEAAERLLALVRLLDSHDQLTHGHSDRVRAYAQMIAEEMSLEPDDVDRLNWAALLHDIGKLEVPAQILTKPGRPADDEWEILRQHPLFGAELVSPLADWLGPWVQAVSDHHEHWNGSGYPRGLVGGDISLAGRIVAVADVFDVITSARSYKSSSDAVEARAEIARCAGEQFDPAVVRAFLSISLGRLRLAMGPLSWLAHAPILGRLPLTPAVSTVAGAFATIATATSAGLVQDPPLPTNPFTTAPAYAAPVAAPNVARQTAEDETVVVTIPGVGREMLVRVTRQHARGRATVLPDGTIRYVPTRDYHGTVEITYEICKGRRCTSGVIRIVVAPVNDPPVAAADRAEVKEDESVVVDVLANDRDPDGDSLTVRDLGPPSVGRLERAGAAVRFVPPRDFNGVATFRYTASDRRGGEATADAVVRVTPVNDDPVAGEDRAAVEAGASVRIPVLDNDTDPDGDPVWVLSVEAPRIGSVVNDGTALTYSAPAKIARLVRLRYTLADPHGGRAIGLVDVEVGSVNGRPLATDDRAVVGPGAAVEVDVLANDTDPDGDTLSIGPIRRPANGSVERDGRKLRVVAPAGAAGEIRFAYEARDTAGLADEAEVVVAIEPLNDAPSFAPGPDQSVYENAGPQRVSGWATAISPGPPDEAGQRVTFSVASAEPGLFADEPSVLGDGTLTYTPAPDANGTASVTVTAVDDGGTSSGGSDRSATKAFRITVLPVNSPPGFTAGPDQEVREGAAQQTVRAWATDIAPGPPDESSQSVRFEVKASPAALFAAGGLPAIDAAGTLRYRPGVGVNGPATVSVRAVDDGGTANGGSDRSAEATFRILVRGVNDPPSFVAGADVTVRENSGPASIPAWATEISPGPRDEAGQRVRFAVSASRPALFSAAPEMSEDGTLTFTPAEDASGTATVTVQAVDDGGTADGGVDWSPPETFTISVTAVNSPPSFARGANQTVLEDAGPVTVAGWATAISPGPADEAGQAVTFTVKNDATALFSAQPAVAANGTLTFTPAPDANGTAAVTVRAVDDGGTANGGNDTSPPHAITVTVTAVNDAPTFTKGQSVTVVENAGPQSLAGWAAAISPGPADEAGQTVTFTVSNDANALFSQQPAIAPDGTLTFTGAPEADGTATVTVRAVDDGGTANGGSDTSAAKTFTITLLEVNAAPSFTKGPDQTVLEDAGPVTVAGWAAAISPGPADEAGQTVTFTVSNDNNALFSTQPAVAAKGTLTFTPAPDANGTATVTVRAVDDGGTANGGTDTSAPQTFTLTVTPDADPPNAVDDTPSVDEDSGPVTFDVLANDTDPDAGDSVSVASYDASTIAHGTLTANGGGSFTYLPATGYSGTDTFSYTAADIAGATDTATVTITVVAVPDPPEAGDDAYTVTQDTTLTVPAASGLLVNDGDEDGDPLTVQTTPVSGPVDASTNAPAGTLTLAADGSFTYTPPVGFSGNVVFVYRIDDGTGRTGDGTVTLTVAPSFNGGTFFLTAGAPASEDWPLSGAAPASATVDDYDADTFPGLSIKSSGGGANENDPLKKQDWSYDVPADVILNGPVSLTLFGSVSLFRLGKDIHAHIYLYDCAADGTACVLIAQNDVHFDSWNGLVPSWVGRDITIGSVSRTIVTGRELRVRLLIGHNDFWVAMSSTYASALNVTLAGP